MKPKLPTPKNMNLRKNFPVIYDTIMCVKNTWVSFGFKYEEISTISFLGIIFQGSENNNYVPVILYNRNKNEIYIYIIALDAGEKVQMIVYDMQYIL